jgi:hypothetical protein
MMIDAIKRCYLLFAMIFIAVSALFFSCKKDKEIINVDLGYNYFPDKKGNYVIYQVDSLFYNDFTFTIDTFQFQIKEKITENFNDLSKRPTQRIERFYRQSSSQEWMIKDVWFANITNTTAEKVEENIRFVKIVFPLKKELTWNGNQFNSLGEQNYALTKLNEPLKLGSLNFDSIIYISQAADSNLIEKKIAFEIYAKNVGLVYKKNLSITDKDSVINYTLPLELRANSGFDLTYKAIAFGNE